MDATTQTADVGSSTTSATTQTTSPSTSSTGSLFGDRGASSQSQAPAAAHDSSLSTPQQQAAGSDPYFVGLYDATGKINSAKYDALPEDMKPYADTFKKYQTQEAKDRAFINLMQLAGKKGLDVLPDNAPPEAKAERAALMARLNRAPEKPEGYGIKKPEGVPDGVWNEQYANDVLGILHKHNASPELVKALFDADSKQIGSALQQSQAAKEANRSAQLKILKEEFGADFEKNIDLAMRGARTVGLDPMDDFFGDARAVKLALKLAENTAEDKLVAGDSDTSFGGNDRAKAQDIVHNPSNPLNKAYHDTNDPRHDEAVKTAMNFNRLAHLAKKR